MRNLRDRAGERQVHLQYARLGFKRQAALDVVNVLTNRERAMTDKPNIRSWPFAVLTIVLTMATTIAMAQGVSPNRLGPFIAIEVISWALWMAIRD